MQIATEEAHAIEPAVLPAPLSLRLAEARIRLSALFKDAELTPLGFVATATLRDLEMLLHDAAGEAFDLEFDVALAKARRPRVPRWLLYVGGRLKERAEL